MVPPGDIGRWDFINNDFGLNYTLKRKGAAFWLHPEKS
jgi:hypothetical protein